MLIAEAGASSHRPFGMPRCSEVTKEVNNLRFILNKLHTESEWCRNNKNVNKSNGNYWPLVRGASKQSSRMQSEIWRIFSFLGYKTSKILFYRKISIIFMNFGTVVLALFPYDEDQPSTKTKIRRSTERRRRARRRRSKTPWNMNNENHNVNGDGIDNGDDFR